MSETSVNERSARKVREGLVVSDKMDKTVVVTVEDRVKHALYGKVMRRTSKLKAHDEQNSCGIGDRVRVMNLASRTTVTGTVGEDGAVHVTNANLNLASR